MTDHPYPFPPKERLVCEYKGGWVERTEDFDPTDDPEDGFRVRPYEAHFPGMKTDAAGAHMAFADTVKQAKALIAAVSRA
jgi:hypothetical protein